MGINISTHRWLVRGETVQAGDEYYSETSKRWRETGEPGRMARDEEYRRRLTPRETGPATAPSHNESKPGTTPTTESKPMTLTKVWITQPPSLLEQQAGKTEELTLAPVEVLAEDKAQAIALVVFANHDKLAGVNLARCRVQTANVG